MKPGIWSLDFTHCYNVNKVIFSQSVQDGVDGVFGDGQPEPLHAAADIHHNHQVLRGSGCLDVPGKGHFVVSLSRRYSPKSDRQTV